MRSLFASLLLVLGAAVWTPPVGAQGTEAPSAAEADGERQAPISAEAQVGDDVAGRRVRRLSDELRSPFCPGKTLMTCTSYQAYQLRQEILEMVNAGLGDEAIIEDLKRRYGADVANPPQPWYTALVPALPFVFGAILLAWVARLWIKGSRQRADAQSAASTELVADGADAERLARLRARVARFDDEE